MKKLGIVIISLILMTILIYTLIPRHIDIQITDVEESINKGTNYLINNQNKDGSISLNNVGTFKVWETANTILVVHITDKNRKQFLKQATDFLLSIQRNDDPKMLVLYQKIAKKLKAKETVQQKTKDILLS